MSRRIGLLALLFAICFGVFLRYQFAQPSSVTLDTNANGTSAPTQVNQTLPDNAASSSHAATAKVEFASFEQVKQAANGDDAQLRNAAIEALANMSTDKALPVLREVLQSGGPEDQQLAMQTMRTLAVDRGDADGSIRDALRQAIYHVNDTEIAAAVQTTLDDVEGALAQKATTR